MCARVTVRVSRYICVLVRERNIDVRFVSVYVCVSESERVGIACVYVVQVYVCVSVYVCQYVCSCVSACKCVWMCTCVRSEVVCVSV